MDDQQRVIDFLGQASSHGLADGAVTRIDTHSAIVFLAGERVYKIKRAVNLGFLDFTRLADRRRFCHAEVKLNRRTAPELYLGVSTLTRDHAGRIAIDGDGATLEYAVVMRRFDERDLFERIAARGELTPALMRNLADRIAAFHCSAEIVTRRGGAAAISRTIAGSRDSFSALPPGILDTGAADALTEHCLAELDALAERLDRRAHAGRLRVCHGDLHLRNICLFQQRPTLFDCIEFNPELSEIDVLYDLAFLLMDLIHRGHADMANTLFNRYLDRRPESDGVAALPLFMAMRAAIRAHVGAQAAVVQNEPDSRSAQAAEARAYLARAGELLERPAPRLVAIGGFSGSGKSSLAYALASALGAAPGARVLRSDVLRKRHFGVAPEASLPQSAYRAELSGEIHETLLRYADALLADGHSVIVDMVFDRPQARAAAEAVARSNAVAFTGFWLSAPRAVLAERIRARRGDASDATVAVLDGQLSRDLGAMNWHILDAQPALSRVAAAVRSHLV